MIPVKQRLTVDKDGTGDCFNACVASILEIPLEECHDILPNCKGVWYRNWERWFAKRGIGLETVSVLTPPKGYSIASIYTDRIYPEGHHKAGERISHAVVALDGQIVFDPHPTPSNVSEIKYYFDILSPLTNENDD